MANIYVKAKIPFALVNDSTIKSVAQNETVLVTDTVGSALISAGLAEAGTKSYTANGSYDAGKVVVNVPVCVITYDANGGEGTVSPETVAAGLVTLNNGAGLTPPEGKVFDGWNSTNSALVGKKTWNVTANITLYAIYKTQP